MSTRDRISNEAWTIAKAAETRAVLAYDGTKASEEVQEAWASVAGLANQLNNDTCEPQHKVKDLRKRLSILKCTFRRTLETFEEATK